MEESGQVKERTFIVVYSTGGKVSDKQFIYQCAKVNRFIFIFTGS